MLSLVMEGPHTPPRPQSGRRIETSVLQDIQRVHAKAIPAVITTKKAFHLVTATAQQGLSKPREGAEDITTKLVSSEGDGSWYIE